MLCCCCYCCCRVAASLLHAAGVPELITSSREAYGALILALARDSALREGYRARIAAARWGRAPVFDTAAWVRALERGLLAVLQLHWASALPQHIDVAALQEEGES